MKLELTPADMEHLDETCLTALSIGGGIEGVHTYVIKKLLYQLVRELPPKSHIIFTTEKIEGTEPFGYVYAVADNKVEEKIDTEE